MKKSEPGANGWFKLVGQSSRDDLWLTLEWDGPETLADGRDFQHEVAWGRGAELGAPWWFRQSEPSRGTKRGDLPWTGGASAYVVVSERFIAALENLGVEGWSVYPVKVMDRSDVPIDGYTGFVPDVTGTQELTSYWWRRNHPGATFLVTERVLDGLVSAGVERLDVEPARKKFAPPQRGS